MCKCPGFQQLVGDSEFCQQGLRTFNPTEATGQACQCVADVDVFFKDVSQFFRNHSFFASGLDHEGRAKWLTGWLKVLNGSSATVAAELGEKYIDITEGVAQLKMNNDDSHGPQSTRITDMIARLEHKLINAYGALAGEIGKCVRQTADAIKVKQAVLFKEMITAPHAKRQELSATASSLKGRLWELTAGEVSLVPGRQSLSAAAEMISGILGEMKGSPKLRFSREVGKQTVAYNDQLQLLRSAASIRGAERGAAAARFAEVVAHNLCDLRESLKTAVDDEVHEVEDEIKQQTVSLDDFVRIAAAEQEILERRLVHVGQSISQYIGEKTKWHKQSWIKHSVYQSVRGSNPVERFRASLFRLRTSAKHTSMDLEVRLALVMSNVSEHIGEMKKRQRATPEDKKAVYQSNVDDLTTLSKELEVVAAAKGDSLTKQLAEAKEWLMARSTEISEELLKESTCNEGKRELRSRAASYHALMGQLQEVVEETQQDVKEILRLTIADLEDHLAVDRKNKAGVLQTLKATLKSHHESLQTSKENQQWGENKHTVAVASASSEAIAEVMGSLYEGLSETPTSTEEDEALRGLIQRLRRSLARLQSAPAHIVVQTVVHVAETVETVAEGVGELTQAYYKARSAGGWKVYPTQWLLNPLSKVSEHLKTARAQLSQLRGIVESVKRVVEDQLAKVIFLLGKTMGSLSDHYARAHMEDRPEILMAIDAVRSHLSSLRTSAGNARAEAEAQLLEFSTVISGQLGEMRGSLTSAKGNTKARLQKDIVKLSERIRLVRSAAAVTGNEAREAIVTVSDWVGEHVGKLREQLRRGNEFSWEGDKLPRQGREELDARLQSASARMEQLELARKGMMGQVQEQVSGVRVALSSYIGALSERQKWATEDAQDQVQEDVDKLRERVDELRERCDQAVRSGSAWGEKKIQLDVWQLDDIYERMTKRIELLSERRAAPALKREIDERVREVTLRVEQLKTAVARQETAMHANIEELGNQMQAHVADSRGRLQTVPSIGMLTAFKYIEAIEGLLLMTKEAAASSKANVGVDIVLRKGVNRFVDSMESMTEHLKTDTVTDGKSVMDQCMYWLSRTRVAFVDEGMADLVGAAVLSEVVDEMVDYLVGGGFDQGAPAPAIQTSLLERRRLVVEMLVVVPGPKSSEEALRAEIQKLLIYQSKAWEAIGERAKATEAWIQFVEAKEPQGLSHKDNGKAATRSLTLFSFFVAAISVFATTVAQRKVPR